MSFPVMQRDLTMAEIHDASGASTLNIEAAWPLILDALRERGIGDFATQVAAVATIATEVPDFLPINEIGGKGYFTRLYENRKDLGNTEPGDGALFHGRGFIQITGRANYLRYGKAIGADLVANPEKALEPGNAAKILATYFAVMKVNKAAGEGDWVKVRKLVNGGLNGWQRFQMVQQRLVGLVLG